ncbi:MAG: thioredoxin family protein [Gemmatimonadota bacterium]|jgi:peroxiredoxin
MARTPSTMLELGTPAPDFALPDVATGGTISLEDVAGGDALLVAFWCNHCPFVLHVEDAFVDFAREYKAKGLQVVAVSANDADAYPQDGPDEMKKRAREHRYPFPYLYDETQEVAKAYRAACTPDLFLFDGAGTLVYRGQFDDSRPSLDIPVTGRDLRAAVDAVLAGETPPRDQHPSLGCNIKWRPGNEPDYYG